VDHCTSFARRKARTNTRQRNQHNAKRLLGHARLSRIARDGVSIKDQTKHMRILHQNIGAIAAALVIVIMLDPTTRAQDNIARSIDYWIKKAQLVPKEPPAAQPPKHPTTLAGMPLTCREVVKAP
jgi:hypothetical protein